MDDLDSCLTPPELFLLRFTFPFCVFKGLGIQTYHPLVWQISPVSSSSGTKCPGCATPPC
ncbi:MAG TPA: hypothetical protein VGX26_02690 [Solirubrobacteraceae bacterium]|nr:hypothetical protein [Solirubrobacteraceae bacterium]